MTAAIFTWWFSFIPKKILEIARKTFKKAQTFFSIDLMLKTLLLPWKKDEIDSSNMALDGKIQVLMMNLVSRFVGAIMRSMVIFTGILSMGAIILGTMLAEIIFILTPVLSILLIFLGLFKNG